MKKEPSKSDFDDAVKCKFTSYVQKRLSGAAYRYFLSYDMNNSTMYPLCDYDSLENNYNMFFDVETLIDVEKVARGFSPLESRVYHCLYVCDLSCMETAHLLGCHVNNIYYIRNNIRNKLRFIKEGL